MARVGAPRAAEGVRSDRAHVLGRHAPDSLAEALQTDERSVLRLGAQPLLLVQIDFTINGSVVDATPGVLYATQGAIDPPTFTLFVNRPLHHTYVRYLEHRLREDLDIR